jgi:hypothetical protein
MRLAGMDRIRLSDRSPVPFRGDLRRAFERDFFSLAELRLSPGARLSIIHPMPHLETGMVKFACRPDAQPPPRKGVHFVNERLNIDPHFSGSQEY